MAVKQTVGLNRSEESVFGWMCGCASSAGKENAELRVDGLGGQLTS